MLTRLAKQPPAPSQDSRHPPRIIPHYIEGATSGSFSFFSTVRKERERSREGYSKVRQVWSRSLLTLTAMIFKFYAHSLAVLLAALLHAPFYNNHTQKSLNYFKKLNINIHFRKYKTTPHLISSDAHDERRVGRECERVNAAERERRPMYLHQRGGREIPEGECLKYPNIWLSSDDVIELANVIRERSIKKTIPDPWGT